VYAANSRETIRRQTIHQFEQARLVDRNPDDPTRLQTAGRQDTNSLRMPPTSPLVRGRDFSKKCERFLKSQGSLTAAYERARKLHKVPVKLPDGSRLSFLPAFTMNFNASRGSFRAAFAQGSVVLYLGDTAKKRLLVAKEVLNTLNIPAMSHDKLPDVVLYDEQREWLFLIEA